MSFAVKYRCEFNDLKKTVWRVDLLEDNFAGTIITLTAQGTPLIFYFDNNSDNVFDPIRESHCELNVWSFTNFALQNIYSIELLQYQVNIYADDVLYWWGYVEPQQYREGYDQPPYRVTIACTDGLSALNCEYANGDQYYKGRRYLSQIILDCLAKIGHTEFIEYVNVYEDSINSTVDDSPFDQVMIDTYVLRDHSCYEVLTEILQAFNAFIRQKDGVFNIIRPKELIGATVAGRHFTAYNTKTSVTLTPLQNIKRTGYSSNRLQVNGGVKIIEPPVREAVITQNYGNRESWLDNHKFEGDAYMGSQFRDWSEIGTPAAFVASGALGSGTGGLGLPYNTVPASNYEFQLFGADSTISTTDEFYLEFDYLFYNPGTVNKSDVELRIIIGDGTNNLKCYQGKGAWSDSAVWGANTDYISVIQDSIVGEFAWLHFKTMFTGLPSAGPYTCKIFPLYNSTTSMPHHGHVGSIWLGLQNIKFYTASVNVSIIPHSYTLTYWEKFQKFYFHKSFVKSHPATTTVKELDTVLTHTYHSAVNPINGVNMINDMSFSIGDVVDNDIDNIPNQFAGALVCNSGTPQVKVDTMTLTGTSGLAEIRVNATFADATFNGNLTTTAADFVTAHASDFLPYVIVTSSGHDLIFTGYTAGYDFTTSIQCDMGNLDGDIVFGNVVSYSLTPTASWGGKRLLQFIVDEVAEMYNRPKELITGMPVYETAKALQINTLGSFQDAINLYGNAIRVFCMNRGTFDVRNRQWELDLFEIGTGATISGTSTTADSTTVTVDNNVITVDNG